MLSLSTFAATVEDRTLVGICIVGATRSDAFSVAELALNYYETPGFKSPIEVHFRRELTGEYTFRIDFGSAGSTEIGGIDYGSIREFLDNLESSPGYGIFLAHDLNQPKLIDKTTDLARFRIHLSRLTQRPEAIAGPGRGPRR